MKSIRLLFFLFLIMVFLAGLYWIFNSNIKTSYDETNGRITIENMENKDSDCPDILIKKGNALLLYNSSKPKDETNPIPFANLDEYIYYLPGHMNFKYNLKNMYIPLERKENNLKDDYMTLTYSTIVDTIWITMYRIKPKNLLLEVQKRKAGWVVGVLSDTYFWEYFTWKYIQL